MYVCTVGLWPLASSPYKAGFFLKFSDKLNGRY